ncbi:MAG: transposase [Flavonifractor plautii]
MTKMLVHQAIEQLNAASRAVESLRTEMHHLAQQLPEYPVVMAMGGVGKSLGPQLMAEIGDVTRFAHKGSLAAYAGVDPQLAGNVSKHSFFQERLPGIKENTVYDNERSPPKLACK